MKTSEIKSTLIDLGFKLNDKGRFWSTNAIWRDGDNYSAVQVYKDSGVWRDFVENTPPYPFKLLVSRVLGDRSEDLLNKYEINDESLNSDTFDSRDNIPQIKMDKTYDKEELKDLLPHYKFYQDKGISKQILKLYQSGFATKGKMYNRYVFPIFDYEADKRLIGFSGRSLLWKEGESSFPKWKHIGTKKNWVYPLCIDDKFKEEVENNGEIYIVESVGDSLALTENGMMNHIVTFGIDISQFQMMSILSLNPKKIIISMNNDDEKERNIGLISSIQHFISLMEVFDMEKIQIKLPNENDLSEMHEGGKFDDWRHKKVDIQKQRRYIYNFIKDPRNRKFFKKKVNIESKVSRFASYFDEDIV